MSDKKNIKKEQIVSFLVEYINENGYPPSVREIAKAVDIKSTSTVHEYLKKLEKDGTIERRSSHQRSIKVADEFKKEENFSSSEITNVPIIGKISAGQPILAVENIEETFPIPVQYTHNSVTFMLKVKGDSMIEAGILDGDLILIKQQNTASNNDIVAALLDDSVTVKTFFKESDHIRLQPENSMLEPILVYPDQPFSILGKVIGVFRSL